MTILTETEIRHFVGSGKLLIEPFSDARLQPTSYDLSLHHEAIVKGRRIMVDDGLTIRPRSLVLLASKERVSMPRNLIAKLFLRSYLTRKGLFPESQGRIEAGFRGNITFPVVNLGTEPIVITSRNRFASIEFNRLNRNVSRPYSGRYQDSDGPRA